MTWSNITKRIIKLYDYYKLTLISEDNKFIGEFERSEIRNIIGVLDNEI